MIQKVLLIGWDGATWDYIHPLLQEKKLPHLESLMKRGAWATLRSTVPPYTNVAWPSLVTGCSPGQTGIFDGAFTQPGSYKRIPANLMPYRGVPIWDWLNRFNKRAAIFNVPVTYPAKQLNGFMVTGFDSPQHSSDIAYPHGILQKWADQNHPYRTLNDEIYLFDRQNPHQDRGEIEDFLEKWITITQEQGDFIAWFWQSHPVDFLFVVFSGTDSINHRTNDFTKIAAVYQAADQALGRILEETDDQTLVCLVSDHGSTPAHQYLSLFRILHDAGWIHFRPEVAGHFLQRLPAPFGSFWQKFPAKIRQLFSWPFIKWDGRLNVSYDNIDWSKTKVNVRSSMGAIYLNKQGRNPQGCVTNQEYEKLRDEIIRFFTAQKAADDQPLFRRVIRGEEVYPNAQPDDDVPDVVFELDRWTYHPILGYPTDPVTHPIPPQKEYGTHTPDGIFVIAAPDTVKDKNLGLAQITDIVPTILAAWATPIPAGITGKILQKAFHRPLNEQYLVPESKTDVQQQKQGASGQEEVLKRLKALGYLD